MKTRQLIITLSVILFSISQMICAQGEPYSVESDTIQQLLDIQYSKVIMKEIKDINNFLKVYINKSGIIIVDDTPTSINNVSKAVFDRFKSSIDKQYPNLNSKTITNAHIELMVLMRKSTHTSLSEYQLLVNNVNIAIYKIIEHYSKLVYSQSFKHLNEIQRENITGLVPMKNYLAEDVQF